MEICDGFGCFCEILKKLMFIFAARLLKHIVMKDLNKIAKVVLNALFCVALLWFFTQNTFLRPYSGSSLKEIIAGLLLLGTMYVNYFLLYPKLYEKHVQIFYWFAVVLISFFVAVLDLVIAYSYIKICLSPVIESVGFWGIFGKLLLLQFGRNIAFNFFPFMFRERKHLQQALESEVRVVYKDTRLIDIIDDKKNVCLIPKDSIYYCLQDGNYTWIYTVENSRHPRPGSMKHLEQLFGKEDFIRISKKLLLPYQYIKRCRENEVFMKKMPWQEVPLSFKIDSSDNEEIVEQIINHLRAFRGRKIDNKALPRKARKPVQPSDEKINAVLLYVQEHPGCRCSGISAQTNFSSSTVERCIAELRKQGLVEHIGTKKGGGYHPTNTTQEGNAIEPAQNEGNITEEKVTEEKSAKKKLNEEKNAEPSSKE